MARPKTRHPHAKQLSVWLSPAAFETIERWRQERGYKTRTETLEQILQAVMRRLDQADWVAAGLDPEDDRPRRAPATPDPDADCPEVAAARAVDQGDYVGDPLDD